MRVRVKGCGKSAPRRRQRRRHGKPHREQDRIGATGPCAGQPARGPTRFRVVARVDRSRRPATVVPEEWSSRARAHARAPYRTRLTGRLAPDVLRARHRPARASPFATGRTRRRWARHGMAPHSAMGSRPTGAAGGVRPGPKTRRPSFLWINRPFGAAGRPRALRRGGATAAPRRPPDFIPQSPAAAPVGSDSVARPDRQRPAFRRVGNDFLTLNEP